MKYKIRVFSILEYGQRRDAKGNPHQEDSIYPEYGKQSESDRLFILCDGMGGHDAGEVASATVCDAMSRSILNDTHDKEGVFTVEDFDNALKAAFDALDKKDNGADKKMGTTMTFLKLYSEGAFIAHIGDSRVYHIRPGKTGNDTEILYETSDHSLVNDLIKIGELTRGEARLSKQKNVITRAMQPALNPKPKADVYQTADIKAGDYFFLCSDGMLEQSDMEDGTSLRNIFSELGGDDKNKVKILTSVTNDNRDNHSAIIIHIIEVINPSIEAITPSIEAVTPSIEAVTPSANSQINPNNPQSNPDDPQSNSDNPQSNSGIPQKNETCTSIQNRNSHKESNSQNKSSNKKSNPKNLSGLYILLILSVLMAVFLAIYLIV